MSHWLTDTLYSMTSVTAELGAARVSKVGTTASMIKAQYILFLRYVCSREILYCTLQLDCK